MLVRTDLAPHNGCLVSVRAERAALGWAAVMLVAPLAGVCEIAGRPGPMAASRRRLRAAPAGPLLSTPKGALILPDQRPFCLLGAGPEDDARCVLGRAATPTYAKVRLPRSGLLPRRRFPKRGDLDRPATMSTSRDPLCDVRHSARNLRLRARAGRSGEGSARQVRNSGGCAWIGRSFHSPPLTTSDIELSIWPGMLSTTGRIRTRNHDHSISPSTTPPCRLRAAAWLPRARGTRQGSTVMAACSFSPTSSTRSPTLPTPSTSTTAPAPSSAPTCYRASAGSPPTKTTFTASSSTKTTSESSSATTYASNPEPLPRRRSGGRRGDEYKAREGGENGSVLTYAGVNAPSATP